MTSIGVYVKGWICPQEICLAAVLVMNCGIDLNRRDGRIAPLVRTGTDTTAIRLRPA